MEAPLPAQCPTSSSESSSLLAPTSQNTVESLATKGSATVPATVPAKVSTKASAVSCSKTNTATPAVHPAPVPRQATKYVPIRPSFRPLLPKPLAAIAPASSAAPGLVGQNSALKQTPTLCTAGSGAGRSASITIHSINININNKTKAAGKALKKSSASAKEKISKTPAKAKKATKAASKKSSSTTISASATTAAIISNDPHNASYDSATTTKTNKMTLTTKVKRTVASTKSQHPAIIPDSVSPASLVTKRSKYSAGSGLSEDILSHLALSEDASDLLSSAIKSLPSPHSSPCSSPSSPLELLDSLDIVPTNTPPLDDWASITADEILAASTEEFFWLSPESTAASDSLSTDSGMDSLNLSLAESSPEASLSDLDDFYKNELNLDDDISNYLMASEGKDIDMKMSEPQIDLSFAPEPFCAFEFSPEPVSMETSDPYGFLDLGINI